MQGGSAPPDAVPQRVDPPHQECPDKRIEFSIRLSVLGEYSDKRIHDSVSESVHLHRPGNRVW